MASTEPEVQTSSLTGAKTVLVREELAIGAQLDTVPGTLAHIRLGPYAILCLSMQV